MSGPEFIDLSYLHRSNSNIVRRRGLVTDVPHVIVALPGLVTYAARSPQIAARHLSQQNCVSHGFILIGSGSGDATSGIRAW